MANKKVYRDATAALKERGLWKGELVNPKTGREVCAFGAVAVATGEQINVHHDEIWSYDEQESILCTWYSFGVGEASLGDIAPELITASEELFPERAHRCLGMAKYNFVPSFNDEPNTTIEDVVAVLARAEELAPE